MFGYIRPLRATLRVYEWEDYRAVYCGVCRTLARRYGFWARWIVNYDFTFLAMLLWEGDYRAQKCRCIRHPFRRKPSAPPHAALDTAADATVLFTLWKLRDTQKDGGFWTSAGAKLLLCLTRKALCKAEAALPETAREIEPAMRELWALEDEKCESIDKPAEPFARMLASLGFCGKTPAERRTIRNLLYHLGRWIYIMDACDDMERDLKRGNYNPVAARYRLNSGKIPPELIEGLIKTLSFSQKAVIDAYALWPAEPFDGILQNIITDGLTAKAEAMRQFAGEGTDTRYERSISDFGH